MSLLDCPVCNNNFHIQEYKVKGTSIPEGFLFCHSSKPTHFIGTLEYPGYDHEKSMNLFGYLFLDNYIVRSWGLPHLEYLEPSKHKYVVYNNLSGKNLSTKDPIKLYKRIKQFPDLAFKEKFYVDVDVTFAELTEELIKNHEMIG